MMTLKANVSGYGPRRVLFLHGWLSDHHVFDTIVPCFSQAEFTIAQMDFRGYGLNRAVTGTYSVDEIAKDALDLCDLLGWQEFQVVGHSMGGMVIQKMALQAPGRVTSAVAATPVPASGFPVDDGTRTFFETAADDDNALTAIFNTLTGERYSSSFLEGLTAAARGAISREAFLGYLRTWTTTDFSAEVGSIGTPVLVIGGATDNALGPEFLKETYLKQLPNALLHVIEHSGHYPMLEVPPEFFGIVETFLRHEGKRI
jgi:pimeloyl-ACP methyl ester carboxylesterase